MSRDTNGPERILLIVARGGAVRRESTKEETRGELSLLSHHEKVKAACLGGGTGRSLSCGPGSLLRLWREQEKESLRDYYSSRRDEKKENYRCATRPLKKDMGEDQYFTPQNACMYISTHLLNTVVLH